MFCPLAGSAGSLTGLSSLTKEDLALRFEFTASGYNVDFKDSGGSVILNMSFVQIGTYLIRAPKNTDAVTINSPGSGTGLVTPGVDF